MAVYVAPISWGLGDAVVSLPVLQYFIDRGDETYFVIRSDLQRGIAERVHGLSGSIEESLLDSVSIQQANRVINLRDHPLQTNYWWGSQKFAASYPGFQINDILREICKDFDCDPDFNRLVPLRSTKLPTLQKTVVFVPGSDGAHKHWSTESWLALRKLFRDSGIPVAIIGQPQSNEAVEALVRSNVPWIETPDLGNAVDVLSSCRACVGVDTGLTHIAVQQNIPTLLLCKRSPIYYRPYAHTAVLEAAPCIAACEAKFLEGAINDVVEFTTEFEHRPWDCEADREQRCMNSIAPHAVLGAFNSLRSSTVELSQ